jgi:putative membrane protein insertion efficiency factor
MINKIITHPIIVIIKFYQFFISPILGQNCRYLPTCSEYSIQSIKKFGIFKGAFLSLKRISKCHPWGNHGYDPVPNDTRKK